MDKWRPSRVSAPAEEEREEKEDLKDFFDRQSEETVPFLLQRKEEAALRYDAGKTRYDLVPYEIEELLAEVYTRGAAGKYEDHNWKKGMSYSRVYSALRRHLATWLSGNSIDREDRLHHLGKVIWNSGTLYYYERYGIGTDDLRRKNEK